MTVDRLIFLPPVLPGACIALHHGAKIRASRKQWKRIWTTFVGALWAVASLLMSLGAFIHEFSYLVTVEVIFGISLLLIATIPCGVPFFNRPKIRPLRNLLIVAAGIVCLGLAAQWLQQGWAV